MMINFISVKEVIMIHDWILKISPGLSGIADPERIRAMVMRVENIYYYEQITDIFELASAYLLAISRGHCFADGNKRTALQTTITFLDRNNYELSTSMDIVDLVVRAASGEFSRNELAIKLKQYCSYKN